MKKIIIILLLCCLTGCEYTTHNLIGSDIKNVYIETFKNSTMEPNLEIDAVKEIIDLFITEGSLKVTNKYNADIVVKGEIIDYLRQPLRENEQEEIEEYRVLITAKVIVEQINSQKVLWRDDKIVGDSTYFTEFVQNVSDELISTEAKARQASLKDIARRIVDKTIEIW